MVYRLEYWGWDGSEHKALFIPDADMFYDIKYLTNLLTKHPDPELYLTTDMVGTWVFEDRVVRGQARVIFYWETEEYRYPVRVVSEICEKPEYVLEFEHRSYLEYQEKVREHDLENQHLYYELHE